MDIQGLNWLSKQLKDKECDVIDISTLESMMVSYQGHNVFSFYRNNPRKLKDIL